MHHLSKANMHANTKVKYIDNGVRIKLYDGYPYLHMQLSKSAEFVSSPDWYYNVEYLEEQRRGYDFTEDLFVPGFFEVKMRKGEYIIFSASTKVSSPENLKRKFTNELNKRIPRNTFKNCLLNSAEQFIVKKEKKTEVIAGFPWFGAWGRDTFIALPGLTLASNHVKDCIAVLDTMVSRLKHGLFPNMGSDEDYAYNTVDASLWFFWAVQQYAYHAHSFSPVWKRYGKAMKAILKSYKEGTLFHIGMQTNGLIYAGQPGKALTWMDAVVNGKPVTPRIGMPVEINALWYNAICFSLELAKKAEDHAFIKTWSSYPEKIAESFIRTFWDSDKGYLADVVKNGEHDWSVRPNQVIVTALKYNPLSDEIIKSVLEVVKRDLLTPRGLRTLAPNDEKYIGVYDGNQEKRDKTYHQGTVWPWLLEHFCEGYLKIYGKSGLPLIKKIISDFEPVMNEHGIGSVSEIYNGDPPHNPKGAISQAWSVAALLRIIQKMEELDEN
jgi:predicted glycogen debranching enzyme